MCRTLFYPRLFKSSCIMSFDKCTLEKYIRYVVIWNIAKINITNHTNTWTVCNTISCKIWKLKRLTSLANAVVQVLTEHSEKYRFCCFRPHFLTRLGMAMLVQLWTGEEGRIMFTCVLGPVMLERSSFLLSSREWFPQWGEECYWGAQTEMGGRGRG
jgi:hypothetical protein